MAFGGTGSATTVARSDHNHGGESWIGIGNHGLRIENAGSADFTSGLHGVASATSGYTRGVFGASSSTAGVGVEGNAFAVGGTTYGVRGASNSPNGYGVAGAAFANTGSPVGVWGTTSSPTGWAGFFSGNVNVVGTLSKSAGAFKIDHPLDPENKYLSHSFVESPDMMNVYNGNITLDDNGEAWVQPPEWFEALNKDFRYQLTPIGAPGPNLYIAETVQNNRFKLAGGSPGMTVSWQVTGIRHDPYAAANRIQVEEDKTPTERGKYLAPAEWGQREELGIDYERQEQMRTAAQSRITEVENFHNAEQDGGE